MDNPRDNHAIIVIYKLLLNNSTNLNQLHVFNVTKVYAPNRVISAALFQNVPIFGHPLRRATATIALSACRAISPPPPIKIPWRRPW